MKIKTKDISTIAVMSIILLLQKEILIYLPNITLTIMFLVLFSRKLGTIKTVIIIIVYSVLDAIILGTFNIVFTSTTIFGYSVIPILLNYVFKRVNNKWMLSFLGIFFSLLYSWIMTIPSIIVYEVNLIDYLILDLPYEMILSFSSFVSILLLYDPCSKAMDKLLRR